MFCRYSIKPAHTSIRLENSLELLNSVSSNPSRKNFALKTHCHIKKKMGANNTREPKDTESQEEPEDHETYNNNWNSDDDSEDDDIMNHFNVIRVTHNGWLPAGIKDNRETREALG
jgi:hypothetical protein